MNGVPFTAISETLTRHLSRRATFRRLGLVGAATALAATAGPVLAQTPSATPEAAKEISLLFVQSFESGSFTPVAGQPGHYALTAKHDIGHTVYFSDRPERLAGSMPTSDFLKAMSFSSNPPNAAFVLESSPGTEAIAVLELKNPVYDAAAHTLTYAVRLLPQANHVTLDQQPLSEQTLPASFGPGSLFIDTITAVDIHRAIIVVNLSGNDLHIVIDRYNGRP